MEAYTAAQKAAESMKATNPIRLGLALNVSGEHAPTDAASSRGCISCRNVPPQCTSTRF